MSSRFDYGWDEEGAISAGLYYANLERSIRGKRGQRALAELEEALLALPHKRLIAGEVAWPAGEVCAIGALALHQETRAGEDREEALLRLAGYDGAYETATLGRACGMSWTLAWRIAEYNDEDCANMTPEERYEAVLAWVRRQREKAA